jgi:hypothetical protein
MGLPSKIKYREGKFGPEFTLVSPFDHNLSVSLFDATEFLNAKQGYSPKKGPTQTAKGAKKFFFSIKKRAWDHKLQQYFDGSWFSGRDIFYLEDLLQQLKEEYRSLNAPMFMPEDACVGDSKAFKDKYGIVTNSTYPVLKSEFDKQSKKLFTFHKKAERKANAE